MTFLVYVKSELWHLIIYRVNLVFCNFRREATITTQNFAFG